MASVTPARRPSIALTVVTVGVVGLVGLFALQWVTGLIFGLIRLVLFLFVLYAFARVGWYLVRKGGAPS